MLAINDGGDQVAVYLLDAAVPDRRRAHGRRSIPTTPRTWRSAADRTVWLADTGDNRRTRATVALIALHPDGPTATVPARPIPTAPHDAEALLLAPDGMPYVVTKESSGASGVYRPVAALVAGGTVALARSPRSDFTLTGHAGRPGGRRRPADGHRRGGVGRRPTDRVADLHGRLRLAAHRLRRGRPPWPAAPLRIALPASPQGEAISFTADSRSLVVASERLPSAVTVVPGSRRRPPVAGTTTRVRRRCRA